MSCKEASPVTRSGLISTSDVLGSGKKFTWVSRQCLPSKMVKNDFSVWAFVKQCIGKELSKITMPIVLNEPLSFLQRIAEYMEYSELLDEAVKESDPVKRMEYVCAFAVSSMSSNANRIGKPFNPLLGETYELHYNNFVFVAEQVSHHPPITAFHVESENYHLRATVQFKIRFWGKSIDVQPKGLVTLELFNYNETYTWQNVNLTLHNVLMGKIWMEQTGSLRITNHTLGIYSQLEFLPANWLGQGANRFTGELYAPASLNNTMMRSASSNSSLSVNTVNPSKSNSSHVLKRVIFGNWCRGLFTVEPKIWNEREEVNGKGNPTETVNNSELTDTPEYGFELPLTGQCCLWRARPKPSCSSDYYSFTQYTIGLNELNYAVNPSADNVTTGHSNHDFEMNANGNMLNCMTNTPASEIPSRKNSIYGKFLPPTDSRYRPDLRLFEMGKIELTRRADGTLRRSIHRKPTWNGQLTSFYSWVLISRKRNLIRSLATCVRRICSSDTMEEEPNFLKETFIQNVYPSRFVDKNIKQKIQKQETASVPKKILYMNLDFKGDLLSDVLRRRISTSLRRTFFAVTLRVVFSSRPLICRSPKDKIPHLTTSMFIYQFACCCGARYIGRSTRILSKRVKEHYPAWLLKGSNSCIRSAIIEHLVNTGHSISTNTSFKVIYKVKNNLPKTVRLHLLSITEALAIQLEEPELCIQKKIIQPLLPS
ncbi:unnamed protein product [Trichobilharzia szidati]|nr:unnamed protein product [Trichobilharzia szidati]